MGNEKPNRYGVSGGVTDAEIEKALEMMEKQKAQQKKSTASQYKKRVKLELMYGKALKSKIAEPTDVEIDAEVKRRKG